MIHFYYSHDYFNWGGFWTAAGVVVALFLGLAGIFQSWIKSKIWRPKINVLMQIAPPDCHKTDFKNPQTGEFICDTYYFRFRVENIGNYKMEDSEAMPIELYKNVNGKYEKIINFLPLNLVWAHYHNVTMPKIQPNMFKHLDFGHITKSRFANLPYFNITENPEIVFQLDLAVLPHTGSHILLPGDYKMKILFAANNLKPIEKTYRLLIKDKWSDDEKEMLNDNILIEEIQ